MFGPCSHCSLLVFFLSGDGCFAVSKGSARPAPWDTTHPPPSPQTANQLLVTSLPPLPLPQHPHRSVGATLTWTVFLTNLNHWDAPPETHLEVIDHLKEAVEVISLPQSTWTFFTTFVISYFMMYTIFMIRWRQHNSIPSTQTTCCWHLSPAQVFSQPWKKQVDTWLREIVRVN